MLCEVRKDTPRLRILYRVLQRLFQLDIHNIDVESVSNHPCRLGSTDYEYGKHGMYNWSHDPPTAEESTDDTALQEQNEVPYALNRLTGHLAGSAR